MCVCYVVHVCVLVHVRVSSCVCISFVRCLSFVFNHLHRYHSVFPFVACVFCVLISVCVNCVCVRVHVCGGSLVCACLFVWCVHVSVILFCDCVCVCVSARVCPCVFVWLWLFVVRAFGTLHVSRLCHIQTSPEGCEASEEDNI